MQAGFALCEAGLTRAKNTGNILMKNMMDFCIGTPCFWLLGFGLMFGGTGNFIGSFDPLIRGTYTAANSVVPQTMPLWCYVIFQTVFCATAATIRTYQLQSVLYIFRSYLIICLSDQRSLDLGRRLARTARFPRFCRKHLRTHGRRRHCLSRCGNARTSHR